MKPPQHYFLALLAWALPVAAVAQAASPSAGLAYPSKPVRYIVPFPPGAGNDIIARIVGQQEKIEPGP